MTSISRGKQAVTKADLRYCRVRRGAGSAVRRRNQHRRPARPAPTSSEAVAVKYMKSEREPVDLTESLLELLRSIDFAFHQKPGEPTTPQTEQLRHAGALAAIGRLLTKVDPTHADRFFVLSDALADYSIGAHPPLFRRLKRGSARNPTQIEAAKANVAFALHALIALGEKPKNAANKLLVRFPDIKALAGPKSHKVGSWKKTILEWRKSLSAPSRAKNELAVQIFEAGRALIDFYIKANRRADLERHALDRTKYAASVGVFLAATNTP
jgi:hypothetical protein